VVVVPEEDGRAQRNVPKLTYTTVADAHSGYYQIPLDEENRKLTTFITPWGRFRYLRTPMGHCAAQDAFTKRFDDAITDIPRKLKCVDDTLLYDQNVAEAFWHTYEFLETCAERELLSGQTNFDSASEV